VRWPVVAIFAYILLGMELAVKRAFAIVLPDAAMIAPSFLVPFVVYIALSAPLLPALWIALILGAAVDLRSPRDAGALVVLGPYALGYMAAAYFVVVMRGFVMRKHPLSLVLLSVLGCGLAELVVVTFFSIRGLYTMSEFSAWRELLHRMASSVYTGASALLLAAVLLPLSNMFGFHDPHARRQMGRRG